MNSNDRVPFYLNTIVDPEQDTATKLAACHLVVDALPITHPLRFVPTEHLIATVKSPHETRTEYDRMRGSVQLAVRRPPVSCEDLWDF